MTASRHRYRVLGAVLTTLVVAGVLAACGTSSSTGSNDCPWYRAGPLLGGSCAEPGQTPPPAAGQDDDTPRFDPEIGRIAYSADGNENDEDDWASAPMALALVAYSDLQANFVHFDYNNYIWGSDDDHVKNMTESVQEGGKRFGFDTSKFFDDTDQSQLDAGVQNLVDQINASTADDELSIVLAGPMETAWMALDAADPDARTHVKCVSHGEDTYNQTFGKKEHGGHEYDDLIDLGCQRVQIPDQNSGFGPTDMDDWDYLEDGDDNQQWLYSRLDLVGNGDVSDAGMIYYVITGDEHGERSDLEKILDP